MENWTRGEGVLDSDFIRVYSITMFLGFVFAFLTVCYFWKKMKYSWEILQLLLIMIVPSSILGARLWWLIVDGNHWSSWYKFSGLSIQGGVTGAAGVAIPYIYSKRNVIDVRTAVGIILPSVLIGQVIGRWGNFANHEVYGKEVTGDSLSWLTFIKDHMYIKNDSTSAPLYRAPLFFYESMLNLFAYIILVWVLLRKNWVKPGVTASLYLFWYGLVRVIMEPLRDPIDIMKLWGVSISGLIAGLWIFAGVILTIWLEFLTMPHYSFVSKIINKRFLQKFKKEYVLITPIKERKLFFFGGKSKMRKKFVFFGDEVENRIRIWLPKDHPFLRKDKK